MLLKTICLAETRSGLSAFAVYAILTPWLAASISYAIPCSTHTHIQEISQNDTRKYNEEDCNGRLLPSVSLQDFYAI